VDSVDSFSFVVAAYVVTATLVIVYTWRLTRRLKRARAAASGGRGEA
jgi:hypothetical protein